jgi:hypothetical protein
VIDWTISVGNILSALSLAGGAVAVVYQLRGVVNELRKDMTKANDELASIKTDLKQLVHVLIQIGRQDEQIKSLTHRVDKLEG